MAFFDEYGRKAKKTFKTVINKAQDMTDTAKLSAGLENERGNLSDLYREIGELYVTVHGNDQEEGFRGLLRSVAESKEKIADYQKKIDKLKGLKTCSQCGARIPKGAAFCSQCGAPVPAGEEEETAPEEETCDRPDADVQDGQNDIQQ